MAGTKDPANKEKTMPFEVYDYRRDIRNVVVTPEIRCRFMRLEPGQVGKSHSHDLGHEVFLILEGQAEFNIDGEKRVLGSGQMCFAPADQMHEVVAVGDQPMIMYLSVTPHLEPTHTWWDERGQKLPPRYGVTSQPEEKAPSPDPTPLLADKHVAACAALAETAVASAQAQAAAAADLKDAVAAGDEIGMKAAIDAMWVHIYATHKRLAAMEAIWNDLAERAPQP